MRTLIFITALGASAAMLDPYTYDKGESAPYNTYLIGQWNKQDVPKVVIKRKSYLHYYREFADKKIDVWYDHDGREIGEPDLWMEIPKALGKPKLVKIQGHTLTENEVKEAYGKLKEMEKNK